MGWFSKDSEAKDGTAAMSGTPLPPGSPLPHPGANPDALPRASLAGLLGSKTGDAEPQPAAEAVSVFSESVDIEGSLDGEGDVVLKGKVRGSISITGTLIIAQTGSVQADVMAREVINAGTVEGNIRATEKVRVQASGIVQGDIDAPCIVIDDGGGVEGFVQMKSTGEDEEEIESQPARPRRSAEPSYRESLPASPLAQHPPAGGGVDPLGVFVNEAGGLAPGVQEPPSYEGGNGAGPFHDADEPRRGGVAGANWGTTPFS